MSNESYERALAWASKEGEIDVVKLLLANGADPNGCYRYALKQASME